MSKLEIQFVIVCISFVFVLSLIRVVNSTHSLLYLAHANVVHI